LNYFILFKFQLSIDFSIHSVMLPKMDESSGILWRMKYKELQEKPSDAAKPLLTQLAEYRVKFGTAYHTKLGDFERILSLYDMVKCYQLVFKQYEKAKKMAEELIEFLLESREKSDWFYKVSGVRVGKQSNKKTFVKKIIDSCN
jgi:hypothetical protein